MVDHFSKRQKPGGRDCVVEIVESRFQGKRKYIKSSLARADQKSTKNIENSVENEDKGEDRDEDTDQDEDEDADEKKDETNEIQIQKSVTEIMVHQYRGREFLAYVDGTTIF